jgi:hypothetical protein
MVYVCKYLINKQALCKLLTDRIENSSIEN